MKSFAENLEAFKESQGFSGSDILELSEITEDQLESVKKDPIGHRKILYKICLGLELDFQTLFDDAGMRCISLLDQYDNTPTEYQKIVTKHFFSFLVKKTKGEDTLRSLLLCNTHLTTTYISRLISGSSCLSKDEITQIRVALKGVVSDYTIDEKLAKIMYDKIINYNYNLAKWIFQVNYNSIGEYYKGTGLGERSAGCVSNWGGSFCASIPRECGRILAKVFGDIPEEIFCTKILQKKDFAEKKCLLPSTTLSKRANNLSERLIYPIADSMEIPSVSSKAGIVLPTLQEMGISMGSAKENKLNFNDDKVEKMFNNLTDENRAKVTELITELFFSQL